jgi:hypothetical protein
MQSVVLWITGFSKVRLRITAFLIPLLLCSLVIHSLDACNAHFGIQSRQTQLPTAPNCQPSSVHEPCDLCFGSPHHAPDLCEVISEVSTTPQHGFQLEAPLTVAASFMLAADFFVLERTSQTVRSRDGPHVCALTSLWHSRTLSGRAPPLPA